MRTFIDLFSGIGGFHIALSQLGMRCVLSCEIDDNARKTYEHNHSVECFERDITLIDPQEIPDHDLLCAGFPCQPFSQAGFKKGFGDTRGTLFSNIVDILKAKQPPAFFLENVRHLKNHDNGRTFNTIKHEIEDAGYSFYDYIVYAKDYGVPQLRPRLFMIGFRDGQKFSPPDTQPLELTMSDILGGNCERKVGYTLRVGGVGSGIDSRHNWDSYRVDGQVVRLTARQALEMQGFPRDFTFPVSDREAMKQLGNSVAVPAVKAYAAAILEVLR